MEKTVSIMSFLKRSAAVVCSAAMLLTMAVLK